MEIVIGVVVLIALVGVSLLALRKKPSLPRSEELARELPTQEGATDDAAASARPAPEVEQADDDDRKTPIVSDPALLARDDEALTPPVPEKPRASEPDTRKVAQASDKPEPPSRAVSTIDARPSDIEALRTGLATTRGGFIRKLKSLFERPAIDESLLEEMEEVLLTSDIGVPTAEQILGSLKGQVSRGELKTSDQIWAALRAEALSILKDPTPTATTPATDGPRVLLFVGVNGVGKTTTIGKLASKFKADGQKILLAAGDTYRAAASLQLEAWGRRVECETVKGKDKSDPASVIFSAVERAKEEGFDVVLADTAGRLHTKTNLMEELKKVGRAAEKALGRPVDEIFLVLDATNGQNAIQQVELFGDALDLTGIVLTKLDGTAKGGVILGIRQKRPIPVRYIGVGEKVDDLREFSAESFVEALFSEG